MNRVLLSHVTVLTLFALSSCKRDQPPAAPDSINAQFVEWYGLKAERDGQYETAVLGPHGATWYRRPRPAIDLSHVYIEQANVVSNPTRPTFAVCVPISEAHQALIEGRTSALVGERLGVFIDGEIAAVEEIRSALSANVCVTSIATSAQADELARHIRAGGAKLPQTPASETTP